MTNDQYTNFIKGGLSVGFTDDQIDFLWEWINDIAVEKAYKAIDDTRILNK